MTEGPDLRILQANERTLLAWMRTGLTLMALGFVLARITVWLRLEHPEYRDTNVTSWLGIVIVGLGIACNYIGARRYVKARRAIIRGEPIVPRSAGPIAIAATIMMVGLVAIIYLLATG